MVNENLQTEQVVNENDATSLYDRVANHVNSEVLNDRENSIDYNYRYTTHLNREEYNRETLGQNYVNSNENHNNRHNLDYRYITNLNREQYNQDTSSQNYVNSNGNFLNKDYRYVTNLYREQNSQDTLGQIYVDSNENNLNENNLDSRQTTDLNKEPSSIINLEQKANSKKELNNENKVDLNELRYYKLKTYTVSPPSSKSYSKRTAKNRVDQIGKLNIVR